MKNNNVGILEEKQTMLGSNVALESQKQSLALRSALQQQGGKPENIDTTGTLVSIFGLNVRQQIRQKAEMCNEISNELHASKPGENVVNLCNGVNQHIAGLQDTISWAEKSGQQILGMPGLSSDSISQVVQSLKETLSFGQETILNTVNAVNEAVNKLKSYERETPEENQHPAREAVSQSVNEIQKTVDETSKDATGENKLSSDELFENILSNTEGKDTIDENISNVSTEEIKEIPDTADVDTAKDIKIPTPETKDIKINIDEKS